MAEPTNDELARRDDKLKVNVRLPSCTLYLRHLRMIERVLTHDEHGFSHEGLDTMWNAVVAGKEWTAPTLDVLRENVPDPDATIEALYLHVTVFPPIEGDETVSELGGSDLFVSQGERWFAGRASESAPEWMRHFPKWNAWRISEIVESAPPTRDGVAVLRDRTPTARTRFIQHFLNAEALAADTRALMFGLLGGALAALLLR